MKYIQKTGVDGTDLLKPRENLPWPSNGRPRPYWSKPFLINNAKTRAFNEKILLKEKTDRDLLRDQIEEELAALPTNRARFWLAEYKYLEGILSFDHLAIYGPSFIKLAYIMPRKLVYCRRVVVRKYLGNEAQKPSQFIKRLRSQFVRSCVLLYPAEKLIIAADNFIFLAANSFDQSAKTNRLRVIMMLRSIHMMTDHEICAQYRRPAEYLEELLHLSEQVKYYKISVNDVFNIPAAEINAFWDFGISRS